MGVKFVTPKKGDSVAVVARSVETDAEVEEAVEEAVAEQADQGLALATDGEVDPGADTDAITAGVAGDDRTGATIDADDDAQDATGDDSGDLAPLED